MSKHKRYLAGFSMIELMIVLVIIAILAAIAIPSYRQYVLRGHRTDATRALQDLASRQENYFFSNNRYPSSMSSINGSSSVAGPYFSVAIPSASSTDYTLRATAQGTQMKDTSCASFSLNRAGQRTALSTSGTDTTTSCWGQ
jgi:type IV pilus assembly protein PilE